jgi:hypothetical protein
MVSLDNWHDRRVNDLGHVLLSPAQLERLASAFELSPAEVAADTALILAWHGSPMALRARLDERHAWSSNEADYFVRWSRLETWRSVQAMPQHRVSRT